jgi:hypothetical protein
MKKFMRTVLLAFTICHPLSYAIVMAQETVNRKSEQKDASNLVQDTTLLGTFGCYRHSFRSLTPTNSVHYTCLLVD